MDLETLRNMVKRVFETGEPSYRFVFQGSKLVKAGISYYERFHEYVEEYNQHRASVEYMFQTEEDPPRREWLQLFRKYGYWIRIYSRVAERTLKTAELLKKNNIRFEIFHIVDFSVLVQADQIYRIYKSGGVAGRRYVPDQSLLPGMLYSEEATNRQYENFLKRIFDLWHMDVKKNLLIQGDAFESWLGRIAGGCPEDPGKGDAGRQRYVVEFDGRMYDADLLHDACIGKIGEADVKEIALPQSFAEERKDSGRITSACPECCWNFMCHGDYDLYGETLAEYADRKRRFCKAYKGFFEYTWSRLNELAWYRAGRSV